MRREARSLAGGYSGCDVATIEVDGRIAEVRLVCRTSQTVPRAVFERILSGLGRGFVEKVPPNGEHWTSWILSTHYRTPEYREVAQRLAKHLGPQPPLMIANADREQVRFLLDPFSRIDLGTACYYGGSPAIGSSQVLHLLDKGRVQALRAILRGPHPVARVYAYLALDHLDALSVEDRRVADVLRQTPQTITTCEGCIVGDTSFEHAIAMDLGFWRRRPPQP
jgi:hypothetical protein